MTSPHLHQDKLTLYLRVCLRFRLGCSVTFGWVGSGLVVTGLRSVEWVKIADKRPEVPSFPLFGGASFLIFMVNGIGAVCSILRRSIRLLSWSFVVTVNLYMTFWQLSNIIKSLIEFFWVYRGNAFAGALQFFCGSFVDLVSKFERMIWLSYFGGYNVSSDI